MRNGPNKIKIGSRAAKSGTFRDLWEADAEQQAGLSINCASAQPQARHIKVSHVPPGGRHQQGVAQQPAGVAGPVAVVCVRQQHPPILAGLSTCFMQLHQETLPVGSQWRRHL